MNTSLFKLKYKAKYKTNDKKVNKIGYKILTYKLVTLGTLLLTINSCSGGGGGSGDKNNNPPPKVGEDNSPVINYDIEINSERCLDPFFAVSNLQEELASQIHFGDAHCVKKVIEMGAKATLDVKRFGDQNEVRPLAYAMEPSALFFTKNKLASFAVIKVLVEAGANMNERDSRGSSFVHKAIQDTTMLEDHGSVAGYFVQTKKADLDVLDSSGRSALHLAMDAKKKDLATQMLLAGANVQTRTRQGLLPLVVALKNKLEGVADRIQEKMPDIEVTDEFQNSALQLSISASFENLASKLLSRTTHIDSKNQNGDTALFTAIDANSAAIVNALLQKGANPDLANNKESPIHLALKKQQSEVVATLIQKAKLSLNAKDQESLTPLMLAVARGTDAQTKALIDRQVDINSKNLVGESALHIAIKSDFFEKAKLLLSGGADSNALTLKNETPMHFVKSIGLAKLLGNSGANIDTADDSGNTSLSKQVTQNRTEIAEYLIAKGANPQWRDSTQKSLLDVAIDLSNSALAQLLMEKGVNPNTTNLNGENSIFYTKSVESLNLLYRGGAKIDLKNLRGESPLLLNVNSYNQAVRSDSFQMIQRLIELGADVNVRAPNSGNSLITEAIAATPSSISGKPRMFDIPFENLELLGLLLKNKANPNSTNRGGDTALHFADTESEINLLREAQADFNVKNRKGETALKKVQFQLSDLEFRLELDLKRREEILVKLRSAEDAKNESLIELYKRQLTSIEVAIKNKSSQQSYLYNLQKALIEGGAR